MNSSPTVAPPLLTELDSILCTEELASRPARLPDFQRQSRALVSIAQALAHSLADAPATTLQTLADTILEVLQVGTAGVSLLSEDGTRFHWPAIAGEWKSHIGGGTPRDFGPCGDVLDRNCPLLFRHPERRYAYLQVATPPAVEALLVPFYTEGKAVGTIWAVAHDERRQFDNEDLRMLMSLGTFASAAYHAMEQVSASRVQAHERQGVAQAMRAMNEALLVSSVSQHELAEQGQAAEQALTKTLAYADDIIDTLREPFLVLDHELRVKTANRSFYDSFHVSREETEKRFVYDLGNGQWNIPGLRTLLDQVLSHNQSVHDFAVEHVFPDLGHKHMLLNARPFSPNSTHPELILLAFYDVSAAHLLAHDLAEASRNKDEFLATLAHELRNPLAPIRNAALLLGTEGLKEADAKSAREIITRQVTAMVRLVDDLLDVSRISRNKLNIRKQRIELSTVLESAVESSQPLITECGHEFTISLPKQPIHVQADFVRLAQVVLNLLNNAAKYTKPGGHIWLTAERSDNEAIISVRDNGIGIPAEMLSHIFDMFTQVERSLELSQGGLGIGLTLVRRLVEMHGGRIEVSSQGLNQGSEFIVRLPLLNLAPSTLPPHESKLNTGEPKAIVQTACRILVVDDNQDSARTMAMLLTRSGHTVQTAHDGPGALIAARDYRPNVILLDIGLPGLSGYEVAKQLRQEPAFEHTLLLALTGYGNDSDRERSQAAGFDHHLVKPVDFARLQSILATVKSS